MKKQVYSVLSIVSVATLLSIGSVQASAPRVNPRPKGEAMGNAMTAVRATNATIAYNPAQIAEFERFHLDIPILMEFSWDAFDLWEDAGNLNSSVPVFGKDNIATAVKRQKLEDMLKNYDEFRFRFNFFPHVYWTHFFAGFSIDLDAAAGLESDFSSNQVADTGNSVTDLVGVFGTGWDFFEKTLKAGVTAKFLMSPGVVTDDRVSLAALARAANNKDQYRQQAGVASDWKPVDEFIDTDQATSLGKWGYAIGFDLGVKYDLQTMEAYGITSMPGLDRVIKFLKPAFGLTYQDVANTRYFSGDNVDDITGSINIGMAVHPDYWIFKNTFSLEFRDLNQDKEFLLKLHIGLESIIWDLVALRMGVNEGYITGGVEVDLRYFKLNAFTYAYEVARYTRQSEGRTIGIMLTGGF